jgi:diaminohydroxyphosphoribosylaminopyrimidine deaminase/5-amino-6-(5-phosphoribosylamino)uracil reductase
MTPDSRLPTPDFFMHRCLELAKNGSGYVAPNPMVGALLVNEGKIIGEGFHQQYGGPHAEVNCINSVREADKDKISTSIYMFRWNLAVILVKRHLALT